MAVLVDSSVLIDLERQRRSLDDLDAIVGGESIALAAVTISELLVGVHRAENSERARNRAAFVEDIVNRFAVLPFDLSAARIYGRITADLMSVGQLVGAHDLLIGATAIAYGYSVLTHNLRDFRRIPGVAVIQA